VQRRFPRFWLLCEVLLLPLLLLLLLLLLLQGQPLHPVHPVEDEEEEEEEEDLCENSPFENPTITQITKIIVTIAKNASPYRHNRNILNLCLLKHDHHVIRAILIFVYPPPAKNLFFYVCTVNKQNKGMLYDQSFIILEKKNRYEKVG
jgi:hypothetical protein